jgi:two-component system response regulator NreC
MKTNLVKIFIVDDHKILRKGLKLILNKKQGYRVVGEAETATALFSGIAISPPDLLIISNSLPADELEIIFQKLREEYSIPFICLMVNLRHPGIFECMKSGAGGILGKNNTADQIFEAIDVVISGKKYFDGQVSKITSKILHHADDYDKRDFAGLSEREIDVLKLFAKGNTYKEIGIQLHISTRTVETHKNNILSKLELESLADMIKYAIRHELIEL